MTTINKFIFILNVIFTFLFIFFAGLAAGESNVNGYKVGFYLAVSLINFMGASRYAQENL